jgi:hypothetical protein
MDAFSKSRFQLSYDFLVSCEVPVIAGDRAYAIVSLQMWNKSSNLSDVLSLEVILQDRLCGQVVRVPGFRSKGPGLIPGATRFSEK